jgi:hypothetical protein
VVKRSEHLLLAISVTIFSLAAHVLAQSGRKAEPPEPPPMEGEVRCDEPEVANQKLVFALRPGGEKHEYKILNIFDWRARNHTAASLAEFRRLTGENYRVKDLFYSGGLNVIMEK